MHIVQYILIYIIFGFIGYLFELCVSDKKNIKHKLKGDTLGERRYRQVGLFFLVLLVLNLALPWLMKLF